VRLLIVTSNAFFQSLKGHTLCRTPGKDTQFFVAIAAAADFARLLQQKMRGGYWSAKYAPAMHKIAESGEFPVN
jgi:hypothetical protein